MPDHEIEMEFDFAIDRTGLTDALIRAREKLTMLLNMSPQDVERFLTPLYQELT